MTSVVSFSCTICQKAFLSLARLQVHNSQYHPSSPIKLICVKCGDRFTRVDTKSQHEKNCQVQTLFFYFWSFQGVKKRKRTSLSPIAVELAVGVINSPSPDLPISQETSQIVSTQPLEGIVNIHEPLNFSNENSPVVPVQEYYFRLFLSNLVYPLFLSAVYETNLLHYYFPLNCATIITSEVVIFLRLLHRKAILGISTSLVFLFLLIVSLFI